MISWRGATILASSLLLVSCALSTREEVRTATENALPQLPDQWLVDGSKPGTIEIGWIDKIEDPLLSELVREAQLNNRNIQAAAANVNSAWALLRQARAPLFPVVNGSFDASRTGSLTGPISDTNQFNLGVQAQWEVDLWGRVRAGKNAAYASAQAVEADFRFSQYSLASAVASTYFTAIEIKQQIGVAEQTVRALAEIDRIVRVRYREGFASAQDTAIAGSDLASAIENLEKARGAQRTTVRALELLLGRYPGNQMEIKEEFPETPPLPPSGLPSELLERRPDIIAAERRVAAAFSNLDQAKAARLPLVSLTGRFGGASSELANILNGPNLIWSIAESVLQPIFDGGLREARVDQADADQKAAIAVYANGALTALNEVENNLDQAIVLRRREKALETSARESGRAYRLTELRYKEGETDLIDVLNIQQRLFSTQSGLVTIRRARIEQWVALNLALGGGWERIESRNTGHSSQ